MTKTSKRELEPRNAMLQKQAAELRMYLLGNDGVRASISFRAYELYQKRGGDHGRDLEDWLNAENEVLSPLIKQKLELPTSEERAKITPPANRVSRKPN